MNVHAIDIFGNSVEMFVGQTPRKGYLPDTMGAIAASLSRCLLRWDYEGVSILGYVADDILISSRDEATTKLEDLTKSIVESIPSYSRPDWFEGDGLLYQRVVLAARLARVVNGETPEQHNRRMKLRYKQTLKGLFKN